MTSRATASHRVAAPISVTRLHRDHMRRRTPGSSTASSTPTMSTAATMSDLSTPLASETAGYGAAATAAGVSAAAGGGASGSPAVPEAMRATYITSYGDNSHLKLSTTWRVPSVLGDGEILIRVHAAALNPVDYKTRSGGLVRLLKPASASSPVLLGFDTSGVVVRVADTGVEGGWAVGDEVFCMSSGMGSLADYVKVHSQCVARKPKNLSHAEAASIPLAGLTALQSLNTARVKEGSRVVVTAGAGGVGSIAVQLAKHVFKASEVATTASAPKKAFVESIGADTVVDYRSTKMVDVLDNFDAAIDCTGEKGDCAKVCRRGGAVASILGLPPGKNLNAVTDSWHMPRLCCCLPRCVDLLLCCSCTGCCTGVDITNVLTVTNGKELTDLARLYEAGTLEPLIDSVFDLDHVHDAFAHLERGRAMGKVVVEVVPGAAAGVKLTKDRVAAGAGSGVPAVEAEGL